ncbi:MAG: glycoside hydrolase family 16 protein [Acidobacteriota bacterium]
MKKTKAGIALVLWVILLSCILATPSQLIGRKTAFKDEFNGPNGTAADSSKWTYEVGGGGWGNQELEYYTNSTENGYLDGNGNLAIKAVKLTPPVSLSCWYGPCQYTSARLVSKGKFDLRSGRFEARIKIPQGQGVWPAFWLLGNNIDTVGWPQCGEIDIMENIGREPSTVHGTVHGPGYSGANGISASFNLVNNQAFATAFHNYALEWSSTEIRWYVDGILYKTVRPADLPQGGQWVFDHPFFIILNFAVGGGWPGNPDGTTVFPQTMLVDYVRVYKR